MWCGQISVSSQVNSTEVFFLRRHLGPFDDLKFARIGTAASGRRWKRLQSFVFSASLYPITCVDQAALYISALLLPNDGGLKALSIALAHYWNGQCQQQIKTQLTKRSECDCITTIPQGSTPVLEGNWSLR